MADARIERRGDLASLCTAVASAIIATCASRQAAGEVPCLVLTGGGGGAGVLGALARHPARDSIDWSRVRFLWGDERWVAAGHEDRNDRLADESLFAVVETDPGLVHRMPASDSGLSLEDAATSYAQTVSGIARIDVALSGVGPDGHVASLFPGRQDLLLDGPGTPDAIPVRDSPKPPSERVSLTFPALNRAGRSWLIAAGEGKAEAVARILARTEPLLPAARLSGAEETVLWADDAALTKGHS